MKHKKRFLPYISSLISSSIFGLSFLFSKKALNITDPFTLLSLRFLIAFIIMSLLAAFKVIKISYKGKPLLTLTLLALMEPITYFIFENYGIKFSSSSEAGLMIALIPIAVAILSAYFLKEKLSIKQTISIIISVAGVTLIGIMDTSSKGQNSKLGILLLVGAIVTAGVFTILSRKLSTIFTPIEITYYMMFLSALFFNCISIILHVKNRNLNTYFNVLANKDLLISVVYLGILSSIVAYFLTNYTLSKVPASISATFSNLSTIVSIVAGVVFLNEEFKLFQLIGSFLIIVGVWGTNMFSLRQNPKTEV